MLHVRPAVTEQQIAHLATMVHIYSMDLVSTLHLVLLEHSPMPITANAPIAHHLASLVQISRPALAVLQIFPYSIVLAIHLVQTALSL